MRCTPASLLRAVVPDAQSDEKAMKYTSIICECGLASTTMLAKSAGKAQATRTAFLVIEPYGNVVRMKIGSREQHKGMRSQQREVIAVRVAQMSQPRHQ